MRYGILAFVFALVLAPAAWSQQGTQPGPNSGKGQTPPPSARSREAGESSSRDTRIDLSPPKDDEKNHPFSSVPESDSGGDNGVQELHAWDPHRAAKDVEVGDFYFHRKNYRAALDRYTEALQWKADDALANFRIGECQEKLHQPDEARKHYETYLKILPHGPLSEDAQKALARLKGSEGRAAK